ncbi:MlaC/ttg2D family ABC transporter substrate-binding protein [Rhodohalobacter halophilus]|uniref:MlaC/ttg2D family ABC transporter substrate-binding protein n=1 Tax=Rhodohalobacter halophilus TaxID=1812810 RepID=UPI00083F7FDF|nr:ABC transporter substrate-binding protein [Rhodohalobacter halophilus]
MKYLTTLFITFFLFVNIGIAQSEADEIRSMLNERDDEIKELLGPKGSEYTQEQRDKLKDIINDVIDFRSMSEIALGDTFHEISDEEREEFVSLFATIIRDNSLNRLDIYRAEVSYNGITVENGNAEVKTMAQMDNVRTSVDYDMELRDGVWYITDMSIDDVSTAESYRRQFQSIIRQRGFDALLESLRRRAARA